MRTIVFELCADSIGACIAAKQGGADRVELCSALSEGGLTPSHAMIHQSVNRTGLPIHVMLRCRNGNFVYSDEEFAIMREDIAHLKQLGAAGVVLGMLRVDNTVDTERTKRLVELATPLEVTFHRAFDHTLDLSAALEDLILTGCHRILTSGGEHDVQSGSALLSKLVQQSAGRVQIAVGGGLRLNNAASLARSTGATHFHGSLRRLAAGVRINGSNPVMDDPDPIVEAGTYVDSDDIRSMIQNLTLA